MHRSSENGLDIENRTTLLLAACRRDLASLAAADTEPLADPRARLCFLDLASRHGVQGLALAALHRAGCIDALPADASGALREVLRGLRRRAAILAMERDHVLGILQRHGLEAMVLKGAGLASTVYRDEVERDFGDIDVLLPAEQIDQALETLGRHGYGSAVSEEATERYRAHHFHLRVQRPRGTLIELHWALTAPHEVFRLDAAAFLRHGATGATPLRMPRPEHSLLHVVVENARGAFSRLTRLVDVDRIVAGAPALDWDYLVATARASGLSSALALALELGRSMLGTEVPEEVRRRLRPAGAVRFHLALLRPASSLLRQRALKRASWAELMRLWLVTSHSRRMALVRMLRADSEDPLRWLWDGNESETRGHPSLVRRVSRFGKVVAYQFGLYAGGIASVREAHTTIW